jgi:tetratricopeptide (TPR) repeat protein
MYINKIRIFFGKIFSDIKSEIGSIGSRTFNLKEYNLNQAIDFFELGMLSESYNRLKIMLKLWSNDEQVRYLLGLLYLINRDNDKAINYFKNITNFKPEYSKKIIEIIKANKTEKIIDVYVDSPSLYKIENEIQKIKL